MTKLEITEGEWKEHGAFVETDKVAICSTCNVNNLPLEEQIANARLIAAAPEMYEALKSMLHNYSSNPVNDEFFYACLKARQALSDAEGRR